MALTQARTPTERFVLTIYARHAGKDDLLAWPGQELIARMIGISDRQVRKIVSELVARGEIQLVRRGAKGKATNVFRVAILDENFDVIENLPFRNSSSGSHEAKTGTPLPVSEVGNPELQDQKNRNSSSCRRDKEEVPRLPADGMDREARKFAEKRQEHDATLPSNGESDISLGTVASTLADHAREDFDRHNRDEEFRLWIQEVRERYGMNAE